MKPRLKFYCDGIPTDKPIHKITVNANARRCYNWYYRAWRIAYSRVINIADSYYYEKHI